MSAVAAAYSLSRRVLTATYLVPSDSWRADEDRRGGRFPKGAAEVPIASANGRTVDVIPEPRTRTSTSGETASGKRRSFGSDGWSGWRKGGKMPRSDYRIISAQRDLGRV